MLNNRKRNPFLVYSVPISIYYTITKKFFQLFRQKEFPQFHSFQINYFKLYKPIIRFIYLFKTSKTKKQKKKKKKSKTVDPIATLNTIITNNHHTIPQHLQHIPNNHRPPTPPLTIKSMTFLSSLPEDKTLRYSARNVYTLSLSLSHLPQKRGFQFISVISLENVRMSFSNASPRTWTLTGNGSSTAACRG